MHSSRTNSCDKPEEETEQGGFHLSNSGRKSCVKPEKNAGTFKQIKQKRRQTRSELSYRGIAACGIQDPKISNSAEKLILLANMETVCEFCGAWFWEAVTMAIHDPNIFNSAEIQTLFFFGKCGKGLRVLWSLVLGSRNNTHSRSRHF